MGTIRRAVQALILLGLFFHAFSTVSAQPVQTVTYEIGLEVASLDDQPKPGVPYDRAVQVALKCRGGSLPLDDVSVTVNLSVDGPEWLTGKFATNPLAMPLSREDCLNGKEAQAQTTVRLIVNRLLGGVSSGIEYRAEAPNAVGGADSDFVFIGWVFEGRAYFPEDEYQLDPAKERHSIPYAIDYRTNGKAMVSADAVQESDDLVLFDTGATTVGPGEGTLRTDYQFQLRRNAWETDEKQLSVQFSFTFAGEDQNVTMETVLLTWAEPPPSVAPAPGVGPFFLLIALLVLFIGVRRR